MKSQKIILKEDQLMKPCTQESFNLKQFAKNLKIIIESNSDERMAFEMIGVDAPVANALRRIMIAEVSLSLTLDPHHGHSQSAGHPEYECNP